MKKYLCLLGLAVILAGCGGGGSPTRTTGATTRQLQAGDRLVYNVTGTSTEGKVSGTLTMTTFAGSFVPIYGTRALRTVMSGQITTGGKTETLTATGWSEQGEDGTIYSRGTDVDNIITSSTDAPIMYPSPISTNWTHTYSASYNSGDSDTTTIHVLGMDTVNGQSCYHIEGTRVADGITSIEADWYVPDWGYSVKGTIEMQIDSYRRVLTYTLRSKNF